MQKDKTDIKIPPKSASGGFSDELDVLRHMTDVRVRVGQRLASDYVLAKMDAQNRQGVIEMAVNMSYSRFLFNRLASDPKLTPEEKTEIQTFSDQTANAFLARVHMVITLWRNVEDNYLVKTVTKTDNPKSKAQQDESGDIGKRVQELLLSETGEA